MPRKTRTPPPGLLFDKGTYTKRFAEVGIDPDTLSEEEYKAWVKYLDGVPDDPPELIAPQGQMSLFDVYEEADLKRRSAEDLKHRDGAHQALRDATAKAKFVNKSKPMGPYDPSGFAPRLKPGGKLASAPPIPKGRWSAAGLIKGVKGAAKAPLTLKGAGALGGALFAMEAADMAAGGLGALKDWAFADPAADQARMLRARTQLIRERQRQQAEKQETERLRAVNMQRIATLNPQLAMQLSAGRILPKNATVIGGRPNISALESVADAMAAGSLDPNTPDPLAGM